MRVRMGPTLVEYCLHPSLGYAPALLATKVGRKGSPVTNTLAYLTSSSMTEGKVFNKPTLEIITDEEEK